VGYNHTAYLKEKPHFGVSKPQMSTAAAVTAHTIQSRRLNGSTFLLTYSGLRSTDISPTSMIAEVVVSMGRQKSGHGMAWRHRDTRKSCEGDPCSPLARVPLLQVAIEHLRSSVLQKVRHKTRRRHRCPSRYRDGEARRPIACVPSHTSQSSRAGKTRKSTKG
jgi:hypothetical protein